MTDSDIIDRDYSLFNNPMINQAKKALSAKDIERYEEWGHAVFDDIDYITGNVVNGYPPPMVDALAYIENSLKSGQHPSTLTEDEINVLNEMRGKEWYKDWGYIEGDLKEIVTIKIEN